MKLPAALKTAAFIGGCLIWLLAGLTVLGPKVGEQYFATVDNGPKRQPLSLTCPRRLEPGQVGDIVVRFANASGKTQAYETNIQTQATGSTSGVLVACRPGDPVPNGATGEAHCAVGPITQVTRVWVTIWAEGENDYGQCELGCENSYRGICAIQPDILIALGHIDSLTIIAIILGLGLTLVAVGARLWPAAGPNSRIGMAGFFMASALMLALAMYETFSHGLAAALIVAPLAAVIGAVTWRRAHRPVSQP